MKIGIDLSCLDGGERTGIPNYTWHLSRELPKLNSQHEFTFFRPEGKIPFWSRHVAFAREIERANLDVFHGPANVFPFFLSTSPASGTLSRPGEGKGRGRAVLTIHDLAIYKHPEWFPPQWFATKFVVPHSVKRADKIIAPSQVTKQDLMELFGVPEDKIAVIPLGAEERFFRSDPNLPGLDSRLRRGGRMHPNDPNKYILFVGTLSPRKNFKLVKEAYSLLPSEIRQKHPLRAVGPGLDYIPDEELPALYQNAAVFVYPSLYEGFGLPVLEAMAGGVPVVTSRGSAMEEFAEGAAEFVDPRDPADIARGIMKYLSPGEYAGSFPSSGESKKVASHYTWERTARETLRVYVGLR